MDTQGPPNTVQRRFLVIMKLSKHKNGHYGSRKIKVTSIINARWLTVSPDGVYKPDPPRNYCAYDVVHITVYDT